MSVGCLVILLATEPARRSGESITFHQPCDLGRALSELSGKINSELSWDVRVPRYITFSFVYTFSRSAVLGVGGMSGLCPNLLDGIGEYALDAEPFSLVPLRCKTHGTFSPAGVTTIAGVSGVKPGKALSPD